MIRPVFWAGLGAGLGITGYRRVTRRLRAVKRHRSAGRDARDAGRAGRDAGVGRRPGQGAAGFLTDVRDGMTEYMDRHSPQPAPTLDRQQLPPGRGDAAPGARSPGIDYPKDGR